MGKLIDGKAISQKIREEIARETREVVEKVGRAPGLTVILVGDDPASQIYVRNKEKTAAELGFKGEVIRLPAETSEEDLLRTIAELNKDPNVDGILVQLPLPDHIDEFKVTLAISPEKDVDGFHPVNMGKLLIGKPGLIPCTPYGIMKMLDYEGIDIEGKNAVIVGRSNIVGKPVSILLLQRNATVTICHSRTRNLPKIVSEADIVVAAVGRPKFIKGDWIKEGAVVIDVGINRDEEGKLVGDVDFQEASKKASHITPVPGGVGPMTITMLMYNTLQAFKMHNDLQ